MVLAQSVGFQARVPAAIGMSIAVHVLGLYAFLRLAAKPELTREVMIDDVVLLDGERAKSPAARARPSPQSMKDFLKLALPARPRGLQELELKRPQERKDLMPAQLRLEDRAKPRAQGELAKLDLGKRQAAAALPQLTLERERRSLEALPRLELVGRRQASKSRIRMEVLEEKRREDKRLQGLGQIAAVSRPRAAAELAPLQEAAKKPPARGTALDRLAGMLPEDERVALEPRLEAAKPLAKFEAPAAPLSRRPEMSGELKSAPKKGVEIEGPLSRRKIVESDVPAFPSWLKELGVLEADVAIKFFVTPDGAVLEDRMQVERGSGFGRLDRLAIEHLKRWRFESAPSTGRNEWGIITFRFVLE